MDDTYETIEVLRKGPLVEMTLQRPEVRNAFNDRLIGELTAAMESCAADSGLRCLVLKGAGPVFCAGADLNWMRAAADYTREENEADARRMARLFQVLESLPFPTVARVQGPALGGGTGLLAGCDIVVAAEDARFGFTEVRLGIIPAVISPFVLRKIPRHAALRYFQTGEIFGAARAREIGLVSEVVPASELDAAVARICGHLLAAGPEAVREVRRLIDTVCASSLPEVVETTVRWIAGLRETPEAREGMNAFLDKRSPDWREELP